MTDVFVVKGDDAARNAYEAMAKVFDEDASALSVLLKVNAGFNHLAQSKSRKCHIYISFSS